MLTQHERITLKASAQLQEEGIVLFAIARHDPPEADADPIVVIERGQFKEPYDYTKEETVKRFAERFLKAGQKYHVTFGGAEAGTATITKYSEGCNALHASITLTAPAVIRGQIMGLATNSASVGRGEQKRRSPDAKERAAVLAMAKNIFRQKKVSERMLRNMNVNNLTAIDVDGDGKFEMVGSFTIPELRHLFLIAEPAGQDFKAAVTDYQYNPEDPGYGIGKTMLIDHLDLDGDGISEIVVSTTGYDAYGYSIYQKKKGRWSIVYSGGGDAC